MPEKRLSAKAHRAVLEKITKGRARIRWDNVVEKKIEGGRRGPRRCTSIDKFDGHRTEVK